MNPVEGEIFRICLDRPWVPSSLLYNGYRVFPGGKERPGPDPDPSPPSSAVGHERVELYLYSPHGPYGVYRASVPVQGVHFGFSCCQYVFFTCSLLYFIPLLHTFHSIMFLVFLSLFPYASFRLSCFSSSLYSICIALCFLPSLLLFFLSLFHLYCLSVSPSSFSTLFFTVSLYLNQVFLNFSPAFIIS